MSDGSGASGAPPNSVRLVVQDGFEAYLLLIDLMDADKERARLGKQAKKLEAEIEKLEKRLKTARASRTRRRPPWSPRRGASSTSNRRRSRQSRSRSTSCRARERERKAAQRRACLRGPARAAAACPLHRATPNTHKSEEERPCGHTVK